MNFEILCKLLDSCFSSLVFEFSTGAVISTRHFRHCAPKLKMLKATIAHTRDSVFPNLQNFQDTFIIGD